MDNPLTLWCFLEGDIQPFRVKISGQEVIDELKTAIHAECSDVLQGISTRRLILYKPHENKVIELDSLQDTPGETFQLQDFEILKPHRHVSEYYSVPNQGHLHVLARRPDNPIQAGQGPSQDRLDSDPNLSDDLKKYGLDFKIYKSGTSLDWHRACVDPDNNICDNVQHLHSEIERIVHGTRILAASDTRAEGLYQTFKRYYRGSPNQEGQVVGASQLPTVLHDPLSGPSTATPYKPGYPELRHYFAVESLFCLGEAKFSKFLKALSPEFSVQIRGTLFDDLAGYWVNWVEETDDVDTICTYEKPLSFPFIAEVHEEGPNTGNVTAYSYRPLPDVAFYKKEFPYFFCEIDSRSNEDDKYRMYIQIACVLRYQHYLRQGSAKPNTIPFIMGVFVSRSWHITRCFAYLGDDKKTVIFHNEVYDSQKSLACITFLSELYNFAAHVATIESWGDVKSRAKVLSEVVDKLESLYSTKRKRKGGPGTGDKVSEKGADQGGSREGHSNEKSCSAQGHTLAGSSYRISEMKPLGMPDHVMEAYDSKKNIVVAKLVSRKDSKEVELLNELSSLKSRQNHVIPLLDIIPSDDGPIIILPKTTPLSTWLAAHSFPKHQDKREFMTICHQLIEGIAFIHRHMIAHLDIKPRNLVYNPGCLYIIDFDLAIRCKNVEDMVEISWGTPGWTAPEIVLDDDKPASRCSPIRADLWSCGKVLQRICERACIKDDIVFLLSKLLMVSDPKQRPLLHEVVDEEADFWTSGRVSRSLESWSHNAGTQGAKLECSTVLRKRQGDGSSKNGHFPPKAQKLNGI